jgi:uncharacterized delta-60 repeat protein
MATMVRSFVLLSVLASVTPPPSGASPGDLDPRFGGFGINGKIEDLGFLVNAAVLDAQGRLVLAGRLHSTFHVQRRSGIRFETIEDADITIDSGQTLANAAAVALAPDGKIVVAGEVDFSDREPDFAVARLNPDLTLDDTFAVDGTTSSDFHGHADSAAAVVVQPDKKILVFGEAEENGADDRVGNSGGERLNEDGALDFTFNGNGQVALDDVRSVAGAVLQNDGKIVLVGRQLSLFGDSFTVARLNTNGSLDGTFGDDGIAQVDFGDFNFQEGFAVALAADGKIVVAGDVSDSIGVARLRSDGTLDSAFDGDGLLLANVDGNASASSVAVQPDGKVIVVGKNSIVGFPDRFLALRYNPDGSPDPTFGIGGQVITAFNTDSSASTLALQSDGMLIAAGSRQAARYRWDGSLDTGGAVDLIFDPAHLSSEVTALAVAPDGKLVAAGRVFRTDYDMALARFAADYGEGLDLGFGNGPLFLPKTGRTLYGLAGEGEEIRALVVQPDGGIVVGGQLLPKSGQNEDLMMGRFTSDGMPLEGFPPLHVVCNGVGFNSVDFGFGNDAASAIAVTDDGKTYAAGTVRGPTGNDFGLVRFGPDCSVDTTGVIAGNEYEARFDLGGDDAVGGMILQNGKPLLAGTSNGAITLIRVGADNLGRPRLDTSFGASGRATLGALPVGTAAVVTGLAAQSDGKLIVSGWATFPNSQTHFVLARFSADGQLDASFGGGGLISPGINMMDRANALAVRSDDTIAMAGDTQTSTGTVFALAQFTADGQVDTGLNGTGEATLRLGPDGEDVAQAVTFVGPNHVVVGGYSKVFGVRQFALAAFETTAAGPTAIGTATASPTQTPTAGAIASGTPTSTPVQCVGDCVGSGIVNISDLITGVNIALGSLPVSECPAFENAQGAVDIAQLIRGVNNALEGCSRT